MPTIDQHPGALSTKVLVVGDSGTGKTGAIASLIVADYSCFVLDFDNGTEILRDYLTNPESPYVKKANGKNLAKMLDYVPLSDTMTNINGNIVCSKSLAWQRATSLLVRWRYWQTTEGKVVWDIKDKDATEKGLILVDHGKVIDWGPDKVIVVDSLSFAATAALNYHLSLTGRLAASRTQNEARRDVGATQAILRKLLELIYDDSIRCNVIVNSHITEVTDSGYGPNAEEAKDERDTAKGYPSAIGRALSPIIPRFFNSVLHMEMRGKRMYLMTQPVGNVLTKTAVPLRVKREYPIENALADYFADARKGSK